MKKRIAIIVADFNEDITSRLLEGASSALTDLGFKKQFDVIHVPGAFEIPICALRAIKQKKYAGVIGLGCVLQGDTDHYQAVCDGVTHGIMNVSLQTGVPVMFGVLMCKTRAQALARCENNKTNKGYECATGLISMIK